MKITAYNIPNFHIYGQKLFQVTDAVEVLALARLVSNMLSFLLKFKVLSIETISSCNLYAHLVIIMNKLTDIASTLGKKDTGPGLIQFVKELQILFNWYDNKGEDSGVMAAICRSTTPKKLVDFLLDITSDKVRVTMMFRIISTNRFIARNPYLFFNVVLEKGL